MSEGVTGGEFLGGHEVLLCRHACSSPHVRTAVTQAYMRHPTSISASPQKHQTCCKPKSITFALRDATHGCEAHRTREVKQKTRHVPKGATAREMRLTAEQINKRCDPLNERCSSRLSQCTRDAHDGCGPLRLALAASAVTASDLLP